MVSQNNGTISILASQIRFQREVVIASNWRVGLLPMAGASEGNVRRFVHASGGPWLLHTRVSVFSMAGDVLLLQGPSAGAHLSHISCILCSSLCFIFI